MKKVLSLVLVLILAFGMVTSSFATSNLNNGNGTVKVLENNEGICIVEENDYKGTVKVLEDNENIRIVEGNDDEGTYKVIVDKKNNTYKVIITKKSDKKVITTEGKLNSKLFEVQNLNDDNFLSKSRNSNYQKTFINYEYFKPSYHSSGKWELRRPDIPFISSYHFFTSETYKNRELLKDFEEIVDDINTDERTTIVAIGYAGYKDILSIGAAFSAIASGFTLTPVFWATVLDATLGTTVATGAVYHLNKDCTTAHNLYYKIKRLK